MCLRVQRLCRFDCEGADAAMADAEGADAAMADVPLYFDPHHFYLSTVLDPLLTDLCSCFQIHAI